MSIFLKKNVEVMIEKIIGISNKVLYQIFFLKVLFPLLGVCSTNEVGVNYLKSTNFMFIGGLILALAVEQSGLHQRLALRILLLIGTSPRNLLLGFMLTTGKFFISFLKKKISISITNLNNKLI